jgi:HK97 family phage portal protein
MLLQEGMTMEKVAIPPEDSQFLETRQFQIPEIARWFNLPPHKLKDLTRSSFSNIESEQISFVTDSILPWLIRLESNYNTQLLNKIEQKRLFYRHNVEGLLRGSARERGEFYRLLWNIGAMSINEIRGKENMDPIDGGNEYFVPMNMVPLRRALEEPKEPEPAAAIPLNPEQPEVEGEDKAKNMRPK